MDKVNFNIENDPNKLYLIIVWLVFLGLILGIILLNNFLTEPNTLMIANSIITNLITSIFVILILYYSIKKNIFKNRDENHKISSTFNEFKDLALKRDHELREFLNLIDQKLNDITNIVNSLSKIKGSIEDETKEIDDSLIVVKEKLDQIIEKASSSSWEDYYNILASLRGYWVEFIPKREKMSQEISIAKFELDNHDKHEFSGKNYITNGENGSVNYSWKTEKVLPPVRVDKDTIFIYYIYKRYENSKYLNKYGFGKLVAVRDGNNHDRYSFVNGFFFNEATGAEGYFPMKLIRLETVEEFLGINLKGREEDPKVLSSLFISLKDSQIYNKWKT